jgi:hypothetical protein
MSRPPETLLHSVATLALAVAAPLGLFSGIAVGVTLIGGPPAFLVVLFLGSAGLAGVALLTLAALNAREGAAPAANPPDETS